MPARVALAIGQPPAPRLPPKRIATLAVASLRGEALLTPKPGLVDRRGSGSHGDMNLDLLMRSADALHDAFVQCAQAALDLAPGTRLRVRVGRVGRRGEQQMLAATGGVNTHRGALWALGLLAAGVAVGGGAAEAASFASRLAAIPDLSVPPQGPLASNGQRVRRRYGVEGAGGEACAGFPHVMHAALPALRAGRERSADEASARLDALLAVMASLADTCVLHRGGPERLATVQAGAAAVLREGGCATAAGRSRLGELDALMRHRRLSPGGSGDLLAAALFLDSIDPNGGAA